MQLYCGATLITQRSLTFGGSISTQTFTLTQPEIDLLVAGGYASLEVRIQQTSPALRTWFVYSFELETPDVGSSFAAHRMMFARR